MRTHRVLSYLSGGALAMACMAVTLGSSPAHGADVKVGGYEFPPFVDEDAPGGGLAPSFVDALNDLNSGHTFTFVSTSPKRRFEHMRAGRFDMMFFEMPIWGWEKENIDYETTRTLLEGGEVYVGHVDNVENQSYFDFFGNKTMAGMLGYHYGFADFNSDREYLNENFDIELTSTHRGNLGKVLKKRIDVAVVTQSFLELYFVENPDARDELVLSEKLDQEYKLPVLISADSPVDAAELGALLEQLEASGAVDEILGEFGLSGQWVF